eukprot:TRINITY_DN9306_c0_g1_i1.p1 TRINITY_DN9306_c0_g1~~TRINITY_DN9306_c0_g1_i1.p1  ORF type:complete len:1257 (-),score=178.85 TRINITY_DN9306_c0_g1_i1:13-3720(-)
MASATLLLWCACACFAAAPSAVSASAAVVGHMPRARGVPADRRQAPFLLALHSGVIDTSKVPSLDCEVGINPNASVWQLVLHFGELCTAEARADVQRAIGQLLGSYVSHNAFTLVTTDPQVAQAACRHPRVRWTGRVPALFKRPLTDDAALRPAKARAESAGAIEKARLTVTLASTAFLSELRREVQHRSAEAQVVHTGAGKDARVTFPWGADRAAVDRVAAELAELEWVEWVEPVRVTRPLNRYARRVLLFGNYSSSEPVDTAVARCGLTGAGQVVGVGDSGLREYSCFFRDTSPTASIPFDAPADTHRKLVLYQRKSSTANTSPVYDEAHGTHVAASVAGEADVLSGMAAYNGVAPKAKLAYVDISGSNSLAVPHDMSGEYYGKAYMAGARIMLNAWGSDNYRQLTDYKQRQTEEFAYGSPDFLVVSAAGDTRRLLSHVYIHSPGTAKNALTVGATLSAYQAEETVRDGYSVVITLTSAGKSENITITGSTVNEEPPASIGTAKPILLAQCCTAGGCTAPSSGDALSNGSLAGSVVVLAASAPCDLATNAENARVVGAAGAVLVDFSESRLATSLPVVALNRGSGTALQQAIASTPNALATIRLGRPDLSHDTTLGPENLSPYTGFGPTVDGRLKPDIVAPGDPVFSASANTDCGVTPRSGSSSAAAMVAGAMALVRQYFVDGYYPSGERNVSHTKEPSASLLKAVAICGARAINGTMANPGVSEITGERVPIANWDGPHFVQGHGRLTLANVLPYPGTTLRLFAEDTLSVRDYESVAFCLPNVSSVGPLSVALVWLDPPASPMNYYQLVNDLDLFVVGPNDTEGDVESFVGNTQFSVRGADMATFDTLNNAERVLVERPRPGDYRVMVRGRNVPNGMQTFALVATYHSEVPSAAAPGHRCAPLPTTFCPFTCVNGGVCQDHACVCPSGSFGSRCQQRTQLLATTGEKAWGLLAPWEWTYFSVDIPDTTLQQHLRLRMVNYGSADPDYFVQYGRLPSRSDYYAKNESCDNCTGEKEVSTLLTVFSRLCTHPGCHPLYPGRWYIGVYSSQCCAVANFSISVQLASCSAACHSLEARYALLGATPCGCHTLLSEALAKNSTAAQAVAATSNASESTGQQPQQQQSGNTTVYNAHWMLYDTIPCTETNCTRECHKQVEHPGIVGWCNEDPAEHMCECFAPFTADSNSSLDFLYERCAKHADVIDFDGSFASRGFLLTRPNEDLRNPLAILIFPAFN